jgi:hypothetical protein
LKKVKIVKYIIPKVYDPVGLLAENQRELFSSETCGVCDEVEKHTGRITGEEG